jgi:kinetochore protein Spc7/SPC105
MTSFDPTVVMMSVRYLDRLETLETLHMFRVTSVNENLFEFVYASQFRVSLPCVKFRPRVEKVAIRRVDSTESKSKDAYPHLSDLFLRTARERVARKGDLSTIQVSQIRRTKTLTCIL